MGGNLLDNTSRLTDKAGGRVGQAFFVSGYATHTVVPEGGVVKIPKGIAVEDACFMGCCIPTGWGAIVNAAGAKATNSVAVYGLGGVGMCAVRGAALVNANPIIAVDLEGSKEELAREMGATHFVNSTKDNPVEKIQEITGGIGVDFAVECIGDPGAIVQCYWSIGVGGKVILPGITPAVDTTNLQLMLSPLHERSLIGTLYGGIKPTADIPKLLELQAKGGFKVDKLTTKLMKLEDINDATQTMLKREIIGRWKIIMD